MQYEFNKPIATVGELTYYCNAQNSFREATEKVITLLGKN